ncbi:MAG: hypothetical protein JOZ46_11805 [Candidatus Dormibacteraeota bacterium]|nr:hypothetical protein [Candidatus Dormibacteraeota bacterium]MBV9526484.1 hypothetical protein [Candidatus Dormibacteraeota bacterium]
MPVREIAGKTVGFGLVAAALIVGGILVLLGSHAYNDYLNAILGWGLIGFGIVTGGYGTMLIGLIVYDARLRRQEEQIHITPRGAPPAPPPPWGMGDIGRPDRAVAVTDVSVRGGGGPRLMSVAVSNIDGPMLIAGLLAWTVLMLIFFAPTR